MAKTQNRHCPNRRIHWPGLTFFPNRANKATFQVFQKKQYFAIIIISFNQIKFMKKAHDTGKSL